MFVDIPSNQLPTNAGQFCPLSGRRYCLVPERVYV